MWRECFFILSNDFDFLKPIPPDSIIQLKATSKFKLKSTFFDILKGMRHLIRYTVLRYWISVVPG